MKEYNFKNIDAWAEATSVKVFNEHLKEVPR